MPRYGSCETRPPRDPSDADLPPRVPERDLSPPATSTPAAPRRHHRWLLLLPFLWQVALIPWANGVPLRPLGLPFPMAWQMVGVALTTAVIGLVLVLDRRAEPAAAPPPTGEE
ncbi:MAG TPA: DUF3311 domain-containing protein [Myxococcaceae bacterium]